MNKRLLTPVPLLLWLGACGVSDPEPAHQVHPPHGYVDRIQLTVNGTRVGFGPFVGYYFKPVNLNDLTRLEFRCYNEKSFYTRDLPENALLYTGTARLRTLPDEGVPPEGEARILPVYFDQAPEAWQATRPDPTSEYRHFHSVHDASGAVRAGYWLRHVGEVSFTYDMGGRVDASSILHHRVEPGVDTEFAQLLEFDRGPDTRNRGEIH